MAVLSAWAVEYADCNSTETPVPTMSALGMTLNVCDA